MTLLVIVNLNLGGVRTILLVMEAEQGGKSQENLTVLVDKLQFNVRMNFGIFLSLVSIIILCCLTNT